MLLIRNQKSEIRNILSTTHKTILVSLAAALAVIILAAICVRNLGPWLIIKDAAPQSVDMLFSFGGEVERYTHSKDLFKKYPESFWIISIGKFPVFDTITLAEIVRRNAELEGLDTSRIIVNDTCRSTGAEIHILANLVDIVLSGDTLAQGSDSSDWFLNKKRFARWFLRRNIDTLHIGLVSHHYHTRRIKMLFGRAIKGRPVKYYMLPVPYTDDTYEFFCNRKWWTHESDASFVISEAIKILYYLTLRGKVEMKE